MDPGALRQLLVAHFIAERGWGLDAAMVPISDHPTWSLPGYRIEGRNAIRAFYARTLDRLPDGWMDECIYALDDPR
jgi:hypothetical protein